ncbi:Golgi apparatus membrane protein TVP23 A [Phlyctochytrium planicorne]|nr:Golgi apparatus membrane protein TVP23 A [Phlyctochytrium planicorne]
MASNDSTSLLFEAAPMGQSDTILPTNNRPVSASIPSSAAPVTGNIQAAPNTLPPGDQQQSILKQSSHPGALVFHILFKLAALLVYLFGWLFSLSFIFTFVIIVLLLSFDFWTVKNVTGRLLVGLRWWNEIHEDGSNNRVVNNVDSRVFWVALYATPAIWALFGVGALLKFSFSWLLVVIVAIVLNMANVIGYTKCEKDARQKLSNYIAGNSYVQGFVGNFISNRMSSFFGGGAQPAPTNTAAPRR